MKNPPAFPLVIDGARGSDYEGMSLRDYFAAAALPALIGRLAAKDVTEYRSALAQRAYEHADAMLKAREAQS